MGYCRKILLYSLVALFVLLTKEVYAQQYTPTVHVRSEGIAGDVVQRHFSQLEGQLALFVRSYAPSVDVVAPLMPIPIEVILQVTAVVGDHYTGDLTLRVHRPLYGQDAVTPIVVTTDRELRFRYDPYEQQYFRGDLPPSESLLLNRLYYYLTVASWLYYDSFGDEGGKPFYDYLREQSVRFIEEGASTTMARGIAPARLLPLLSHESTTLFREAYYYFHRSGLDQDEAVRLQAAEVTLTLLERIAKLSPVHPLLTLFADTKGGDLAQILKEETPEARALRHRYLTFFPTLSLR